MPITSLPTPPSRTDAANFNARADAFLGALRATVQAAIVPLPLVRPTLTTRAPVPLV